MVHPQQNSAELMSAYLDAELDPAATEEFERFLADSPEAQEQLADMRKLLHLMGGLASVQAPAGFAEKVGRKIRRQEAFSNDAGLMGLVTVPFQVISVIVILTVAAMYMLAQLDEKPRGVERVEPTEAELQDADAPRPIVR